MQSNRPQIVLEPPCLLYPNLDFEEELAGGAAASSRVVSQVLRDIGPVMAFAARAGDQILTATGVVLPRQTEGVTVTDDLPSDLKLIVPWGWSAGARRLAARIGMPQNLIPTEESVRQVNDRRFLIEHDLVAMPDGLLSQIPVGQFCTSMADVHQAVRTVLSFGDRWVMKPQFSQAARNRLTGGRDQLSRSQQKWVESAIDTGVTVEPWLERQTQAGLQFEITPSVDADGSIRFLGVAELLTTAGGQYLGSVLVPGSEATWAAAIEHGTHVCVSLRDAGYFGPVGIDAFRYLSSAGHQCVRLCHDINARWTMGRLALCLNQFCDDGETAVWLHLSPSEVEQICAAAEKGLREPEVAGVRTLNTGCRSAELQFASVLLIGETKQRLQRFLNSCGCSVEIPD